MTRFLLLVTAASIALVACSEESLVRTEEVVAIEEEAPSPRDVPGLPPLFEADAQFPQSPLAFEEYMQSFGGTALVDLETRDIRQDVVQRIQSEMVGKQIIWDGYISKVDYYPSGRVMLVLGSRPEPSGLGKAFVKFAATADELIQTHQVGDLVRVVAVYDRLQTVFPELRGISIEAIEPGAEFTSVDRQG